MAKLKQLFRAIRILPIRNAYYIKAGVIKEVR